MADTHPLKLAYAREYPGELATYLATQGVESVARALDGLPPESAAALVARLPHGHAARVLAGQDSHSVAGWMNAARPDDALTLLLYVEETRRPGVLDSLSNRHMRRTLERLMIYPKETVGALVNPSAMRLNAAMPLAEAVTILRADEPEPDESIWLVNDDGRYLGLLDVGAALVSRSDTLNLDAFLIPVRPLRAETGLVSARDFAEWLRHPELPVTDHLDHLLGTVSRARLMSALSGANLTEQGLIKDFTELTRQYFRIMGICLSDLFSLRGQGQ